MLIHNMVVEDFVMIYLSITVGMSVCLDIEGWEDDAIETELCDFALGFRVMFEPSISVCVWTSLPEIIPSRMHIVHVYAKEINFLTHSIRTLSNCSFK